MVVENWSCGWKRSYRGGCRRAEKTGDVTPNSAAIVATAEFLAGGTGCYPLADELSLEEVSAGVVDLGRDGCDGSCKEKGGEESSEHFGSCFSNV